MAKSEYLTGKGTPFTRKRPYSVYIKDGYTPKMRAAEYYLPATLEFASLRCRDIINNKVKEKFMERRAKGPHKTPTSRKLYQQWGYIPNITLLMSGQLEDAVIDMKAEHYRIRHQYIVDVYSNFPSYTGYMEFGVKRTGGFIPGKRIKARPFIMDALKESMTDIQEEYGAAVGSINAIFADPMEKYTPPLEVSSTQEITLLQFGALGMYGILFTLMPPTVLLAAYGAFYDITSLLSGRFTAATTMMFVRSMLLGRAGMTKKVWRRKIRRRIWA